MWITKKNRRCFFSAFFCLCLTLACAGQQGKNEKAYLKILKLETQGLNAAQTQGYLQYLEDSQKQLPKSILKKNRYVAGINAEYAQMDRQAKNVYIETWRPQFTTAWKEYEAAFQKLKSDFQPVTEEEKSIAQKLELEWQDLMQKNEIVSLEPPLFSVSGD